MIQILIGGVIYLIGSIGLLIAEFKENIIWCLAGFFTQVAHVIFALIHFDKCKKSLGYMLLGFVLMLIGAAFSVS